MATIFQTPKRMASFPAAIPIYRTSNLPTKQLADSYWKRRLEEVSLHLGFTILKPQEDKQHVFNREGPLHLQLFKASDSFLFYNRDLIDSDILDQEMMNPKKAKNQAVELLKKQNLIYRDGTGLAPFQLYYGGAGYTLAQTADVGLSTEGKWSVSDESEPYKTEIRSHFGYLLNGLPVFGPGAKTIISHVGENLSEEIQFWRNPKEIVSEKDIIAPDTAISRLCKDNRFVKVLKLNKKYPRQSSGRFYDDVELGYYATPPTTKQRFYIPVYKVRGTFESRINLNGNKLDSSNETAKTFRYDFVHYVSAMHGDGADFQMKDFKRQIIF